jgi:hypothetical protein
MRHARDGVAAAIDAATRVLSISGRLEPPEGDNPHVVWGYLASEGVWAPTRDGQRIHISITGINDDRAATTIRPTMRLFLGVDTETDVMAVTTTSGVRFITILHGPGAPPEFRFPLRLSEGLVLDPAPSGGYDVVHERYGATVGRFQAPWGYDSLYRPVRADYRIEKGAIVMGVRHHEADALYPVVADPHYVY